MNTEPQPNRRVTLGSLTEGEILEFETSDADGENIWTYLFYVTEPGEWPSGNLWAISPEGQITEQLQTSFHGCGNWTTQKQNPVQTQFGRAFTPVFGELVVGCYPTFNDPSAPQGDRVTLSDRVTRFEVKSAEDYAPDN